jgi:hypothetical protein
MVRTLSHERRDSLGCCAAWAPASGVGGGLQGSLRLGLLAEKHLEISRPVLLSPPASSALL